MHSEVLMFETLLTPEGIALFTSLAAPVGSWVAQSSLTMAQSFAESETNSFIKSFIRKRITEKQLQNAFSQAVQATIDDTTLSLSPAIKAELVDVQRRFKDFSKFVNQYHQLSDLPPPERREAAQQKLREYVQTHAPSSTGDVLDSIEKHFSEAAFEVIKDSIKRSPETFCQEALQSLERIEAELKRTAAGVEANAKNLEVLRAVVEYYLAYAPDLEEIRCRLADINTRIGELHAKVDKANEGIDEIKARLQATLGKNREYNDLVTELVDLEETLSAIPEEKSTVRLKISQKIEEKRKEIEIFKQDVIKLAETFSDRSIDSERLRQARAYFEAGDFEKTREVLNAEAMKADQEYLLERQAELDQKQADTRVKLQHNAMEFLVKAQATVLDLANPGRFSEADQYYRDSIRSFPAYSNLFDYALFLQNQRQYDDALAMYYRVLNELHEELTQDELAGTLNNLGALHAATNDHASAEREYTEALEIRRELAAANPAVYRPDVATTLNNLGALHAKRNDHASAEREYTEALEIRRELAAANPAAYRPDVAATLNNLAILHADTNDHASAERDYTEALGIFRELAAANPAVYQPAVAMILDNCAELHEKMHEYERAQREREEARRIREALNSS